ncbi:MAG TPA: repressor LexA [Firmicutes bacterium]|nr:repressor LexA [Bacillota bacterium]HBK61128.1 repressor LexA [Bacillota bacterium]
MVGLSSLSARERQILQHIAGDIEVRGYPPSVREIGEAVGLRSSSTVHGYLSSLERKGYIRRDPAKPRAIEVLLGPDQLPPPTRDIMNVPVVGRVTAGQPILAVENVDDYFPLPRSLAGEAESFMLRVSGESMVGAGILDGDYVIVRKQQAAANGEIVVAMIGDEATVKRLFREDGIVRLEPENPAYEPIVSDSIAVLGKVIGLVRKIH